MKATCIKKNFGKTEITINKDYEILKQTWSLIWIIKDNGKKAALDKRQFRIYRKWKTVNN